MWNFIILLFNYLFQTRQEIFSLVQIYKINKTNLFKKKHNFSCFTLFVWSFSNVLCSFSNIVKVRYLYNLKCIIWCYIYLKLYTLCKFIIYRLCMLLIYRNIQVYNNYLLNFKYIFIERTKNKLSCIFRFSSTWPQTLIIFYAAHQLSLQAENSHHVVKTAFSSSLCLKINVVINYRWA